jgi:PRTRC genetic system ThiF family protein
MSKTGKEFRPPQIDTSFRRAATVLAVDFDDIEIMLVGLGGTGSYMAESIGRLLVVLEQMGKRARATFVDPDTVEEKNIGRQRFSRSEIGRAKAETLQMRIAGAWGLDITYKVARFDPSMVTLDHDLTVLVGCVDNAAGRRAMSAALAAHNRYTTPPRLWCLDCGNHEDSGQVRLGSAAKAHLLKGAFPQTSICQALPSPALQSPELLKAQTVEQKSRRMGCAELAAANHQSLNINMAVATEASDMLTRLLVTRNLKRFSTEINLAAGVVRSDYATPEAVARVVGKSRLYVTATTTRHARRAPGIHVQIMTAAELMEADADTEFLT